ncbi:uncharacterized protein LOC131801503 [Musca domestica]|uniref:Uncharacterized protein LOC131801503 n=1 Tax=Musca domestica TaxID=7370 RepID=A0ABM3URT4_MUSDO|nr:uncharacterized protein LOC131801503 [Musca domestica]
MFRLLLPTTAGKQQQIAILIISFFLYVDGIRNEGSNMLPLQQQQQQPIENSNYQSSSPSKTAFKASPLIEFTLDDVTIPHMTHEEGGRPSFEDAKYPNNNLPSTPTATNEGPNDNGNDNRRISTSYTNGEKQFSFSNEQQQQRPTQYQQQQQHQFAQHLTETPIYIYKDPYTNENYHYTPTEPSYNRDVVLASSPATYNQQADNYNIQNYNSAPSGPQDNQEYLVHSSMIVGTQQQQQSGPFSLPPANKDVYLKRPGQVYDESYIPHPNAVIEKKSEVAATKKANKISYDSHDYPPPSYHQLQTSNFLPTPNPEGPARATPPPPVIRATPPPPLRATPPPPPASYSPSPNYFARPTSAPPAYVTPRPSYSDEYRPKPPSSPFGQQYLQSSQNVLPNYVNNLDNYLSNQQQTQYYRPEQAAGPPPPSSQYLQYEETIPPPYRQPPQQQQQQQYQPSSYPPFEQQHQQRPQYPSYQPSQYPSNGPPSHQSQPPFSSRPSYNNYYDYQIGEVPPQTQGAFNYPYPRPPPPPQSNGPYRPPYVPPSTTQQPSGLATLVQYAPQFTSLLLGGGGGSSSNTNSPLGSLLGVLTGAGNNPQSSSSSSPSSSSSSLLNRRPINSQLIKALENIARNDDLQCVPKVLCQMIASQTQRGQLPSFITSPAITNFLAAFPASSPALIYGRAALLGISGGDRSCHQTYVKCPKNEIEIINYLNNYRGGFFKFFSEPDDQTLNQQNGNHDSFQSGGATSLFSILSALTGTPAQPQVTTPRPRPKPQPTAASSDITETIGNFFTNLLSDYMGGGAVVEYQRRSARRKRNVAEKRVRFEEDDDDEKFNFDEDYNDEEDTDDTEKNVEFQYEPEEENGEKSGSESRVIHRLTLPKEKRLKFFPDSDSGGDEEEHLRKVIEKFNEFNKGRKLKFPADTSEREYIDVAAEYLRGGKQLDYNSKGQEEEQQVKYGHQYNNYEQESYVKDEDSKKIKFYDDPEEKMSISDHSKELRDLRVAESHHTGKKIRFPEREPKILNRPNYAASFSYQQQQQPTPPEYEETEDHQKPNYYKELEDEQQANLYNNQADYGESSNPYDYNQYQAPSRPQNYYGYHQGLPPSSVGIYNTHLTSLNSVSNYVSNTATNLNYFVTTQSPSNAGGSANYFLPTPAPDTADVDNNYDNNLYNNDNNLATNQKDYNSNYDSNHNNYYYNKYQKYTNSSSHKYNRYQSYTTTNSNNLNSQTYNSNRYRPAYNRPQSDVSNTNNNSNNVYNRYHSSLYQRRTTTTTTTTTPRPNDNNIYVTNARGETEYYIRPDGRKVYL